jgi:hypothetical protein
MKEVENFYLGADGIQELTFISPPIELLYVKKSVNDLFLTYTI